MKLSHQKANSESEKTTLGGIYVFQNVFLKVETSLFMLCEMYIFLMYAFAV